MAALCPALQGIVCPLHIANACLFWGLVSSVCVIKNVPLVFFLLPRLFKLRLSHVLVCSPLLLDWPPGDGCSVIPS